MVSYLNLIVFDPKDPDEVLDYKINWAKRLGSDTIVSSTWDVPSGLTHGPPADTFTNTTTTVWLSGGTLDAVYDITNHIVTAAGRHMDQSARLKIKLK